MNALFLSVLLTLCWIYLSFLAFDCVSKSLPLFKLNLYNEYSLNALNLANYLPMISFYCLILLDVCVLRALRELNFGFMLEMNYFPFVTL